MAKTKTSGLTLKHKIGYGCGDGGGLFTFGLMSGFFTRYCLNILGVSTEMLASLLLIWNIWDAVNDPLMGTLMDKAFAKNHDKRGKFRPWVLRATPMRHGNCRAARLFSPKVSFNCPVFLSPYFQNCSHFASVSGRAVERYL